MYKRLLSFLVIAGMAWPVAAQVELPNEFQSGDPASAEEVNANFDALTTGLNELATRVTDLEPESADNPPLAIETTLGDALSLLPVRGIEQGGLLHERGAIPDPDPIVVRGLPGTLSELIEYMTTGRRIDGRLMRVESETGMPLLGFARAYVTQLEVPAVGPQAETPFLVALTVDPEEVDLGPFSSEQALVSEPGSLFEPSVELSLGSLGVTVAVPAVDPVVVTRPRGSLIGVADNPVLHIAAADADEVLEAFMNRRRIYDIAIRYQRPDGGTVLAVTAEYAYIEYAKPDYAGDGVKIGLRLENPGLVEY